MVEKWSALYSWLQKRQQLSQLLSSCEYILKVRRVCLKLLEHCFKKRNRKEKAEAEQEYKLLSKVVTKSLERTQDWIRNKS